MAKHVFKKRLSELTSVNPAAPVCYKNVTFRINAIFNQIIKKYEHETIQMEISFRSSLEFLLESDSLKTRCHNHQIIFFMIKVWKLKIVRLKKNRILSV